jgi:hypothetical protein
MRRITALRVLVAAVAAVPLRARGADPKSPALAVGAYIKKIGIPFPVATLTTTDKNFLGDGIAQPAFLFIDKAGIVRDLWSGANDTDERDPLLGHLQKIGLA